MCDTRVRASISPFKYYRDLLIYCVGRISYNTIIFVLTDKNYIICISYMHISRICYTVYFKYIYSRVPKGGHPRNLVGAKCKDRGRSFRFPWSQRGCRVKLRIDMII